MNNLKCPFHVGDRVAFSPSSRTQGLYQDIGRFGVAIGEVITIEEIRDECYLYCKGGAGGWPWNEWSLVAFEKDMV